MRQHDTSQIVFYTCTIHHDNIVYLGRRIRIFHKIAIIFIHFEFYKRFFGIRKFLAKRNAVTSEFVVALLLNFPYKGSETI